MKIKTFICDKINRESLIVIEKEVNMFTMSHEVTDIKINTVANNFGAVIIYTIIYEGEE